MLDALTEIERGITSFCDNMDGIVRDSLVARKEELLDMQREQLFEGKSSSGEDLRPSYSEDIKPNGYFNTLQAAENYKKWKEQLTYPSDAVRNPDAPNLYINGKFHLELDIEFADEYLCFCGSTNYSRKIISKYGEGNFGLTKERWGEVSEEYIKPELVRNFFEMIEI